ncbi:Dam family site-specific DNA-(adenine-N6)-methyltransferase [Achromobacter insuavis]|uniref:Dam family site-specific DNA-(adenine-N6)-methyltransferase n=1 Tax=Achromobacter insuavis TaxID=1287735 RepID=UPI000E308381|nr:Dam family site-specific DNA-(adenine-N6)-methyltransferase [Achromobacter insuavis]
MLNTPEYTQVSLFDSKVETPQPGVPELKGQLLKWVGNKQKFAVEIINKFPHEFGTYFEPFLGSGGVLATLAPKRAVAGDVFKPLIEIWEKLHDDTEGLIDWYSERHALIDELGKKEAYEQVLASYNAGANGADLLFLSRVCYGGVVRFRKSDGYMSTPCGPHKPMPPENFAERARIWAARTRGAVFCHSDFAETMALAKKGDMVYLDPPYVDSQAILYGAQSFSYPRLLESIADCKKRGVYVALSIDGTKKSGGKTVELPTIEGLFEREVMVRLGSSMLKRYQLKDQTAEDHHVEDRLLLTY